jgi:hypothetical protein
MAADEIHRTSTNGKMIRAEGGGIVHKLVGVIRIYKNYII